MSIKTLNVTCSNPDVVYRLLENASRLQKEDVILDYRQFGNGLQILYIHDGQNTIKRSQIERSLYENVQTQLIFSWN